MTDEDRKADEALVLKERARALAKGGASEVEDEGGEEVVEFSLSGERYAFRRRHVHEVLPLRELTPVPGVWSFILGVMSIRGTIVTVNDLRRLFELPASALSDRDRVLVLRHKGMEMGILADNVIGFRRVPAADLVATLPTLTGVRERYLEGVTADRLIVLDALRLLRDPSILVKDDVLG